MFDALWDAVMPEVTATPGSVFTDNDLTTTAPRTRVADRVHQPKSTWADLPPEETLFEKYTAKEPQTSIHAEPSIFEQYPTLVEGESGPRFGLKMGETKEQYRERHLDAFKKANPGMANTLFAMGRVKGLVYHAAEMMVTPTMVGKAGPIVNVIKKMRPVVAGAYWMSQADQMSTDADGVRMQKEQAMEKSNTVSSTLGTNTFQTPALEQAKKGATTFAEATGLRDAVKSGAEAGLSGAYEFMKVLDFLSVDALIPQSMMNQMEFDALSEGAAIMGYDPFTSQERAAANIAIGRGVAQRLSNWGTDRVVSNAKFGSEGQGLFSTQGAKLNRVDLPLPDPSLFGSLVSDNLDAMADLILQAPTSTTATASSSSLY